jgi:hypothetical protein
MLKKISCFLGIVILAAAFSGCGTMSKMTAGSFYDSPDIEALQARATALEAGTNWATANAAYAAVTNAIVVETNRAQVAEAALGVLLVTETNRAQVAEAALGVLLVTETNRAQVAEALLTPKTAVVKTMSGVATPNANGGTNVVVYTAKDLAGATLAQYTTFRVWIGDTQYGAPSAVAGSFTVSGGVKVQEIVDKADYIVMTSAAGTVTLTVCDDPGRTNYIHAVVGGGTVLPTTMNWNTP